MVNEIYISLGGNKTNTSDCMDKAIEKMSENGKVLKKSDRYVSNPWGYNSPHAFLNQAVLWKTHLSPKEALKFCQEVERDLGRHKTIQNQYQDRSIDLDILFYNDSIVRSEALTIPHPLIAFRNFVLVPMAQIASDLVHPESNLKISQLLEHSTDSNQVVIMS